MAKIVSIACKNEIPFPVSAIRIFLLKCSKASLMMTSRGRNI